MARDLRLLLIEDSEDDCLLLLRELKRAGWVVVHDRVDTIPALERAMASRWDAIVSDYSLPTFSAPDALAVVRARTAETPFIIVSGTVDEETAVSAMRAGARRGEPSNRAPSGRTD